MSQDGILIALIIFDFSVVELLKNREFVNKYTYYRICFNLSSTSFLVMDIS